MQLLQGGRANVGSPKPSETAHQPWRVEMELLANIFACIFGELTADQRAAYLPDQDALKAA